VNAVIDSDLLIWFLRGMPEARRVLRDARLREARLLSITPVRTEVLRGVRPGEEKPTTELLDLVEWVSVDVGLADRAGELGQRYQHWHQGIEVVDLLLAAASERYGAELLTRNVRHFPMFPELKPAF
jgi:predicted nucleic acid-binding protein